LVKIKKMISHLKTIIPKLKPKQQALGAFNTYNLEITRAILEAADEKRKPLIIQITEKSLKYAGLKTIFNVINNLTVDFPARPSIAIHLDHGKDINLIKKCVDLGFSSVHFDGSELPFKKNIELTKKVVQYARPKNVWVQGEVGMIGGKEQALRAERKIQEKEFFTNPEQALEFVKRTKVDTLAVSVGSLHGQFKGREKLDFPRIEEIKGLVKTTPLVLHGGSGVSRKELIRAIASGITIFNLDTTLRIAFITALKKDLKKNKDIIDPRFFLDKARSAVKDEVKRYLDILS
jgi:ketose-bisphosphate aldolase